MYWSLHNNISSLAQHMFWNLCRLFLTIQFLRLHLSLKAPTQTSAFSFENVTFFMRFRRSSTLKHLKTLMKTESFKMERFDNGSFLKRSVLGLTSEKGDEEICRWDQLQS